MPPTCTRSISIFDLTLADAPVHPMHSERCLPMPGGVTHHEVKSDGQNRPVMMLCSAGEKSRCPECGRPLERVHSQQIGGPGQPSITRVEARVSTRHR